MGYYIDNEDEYDYEESNKYSYYYIHRNGGNSVFVKEGKFFEDEGGLTQEWGKAWKKVYASSIEHARLIGETTLPKFSYPWNRND